MNSKSWLTWLINNNNDNNNQYLQKTNDMGQAYYHIYSSRLQMRNLRFKRCILSKIKHLVSVRAKIRIQLFHAPQYCLGTKASVLQSFSSSAQSTLPDTEKKNHCWLEELKEYKTRQLKSHSCSCKYIHIFTIHIFLRVRNTSWPIRKIEGARGGSRKRWRQALEEEEAGMLGLVVSCSQGSRRGLSSSCL